MMNQSRQDPLRRSVGEDLKEPYLKEVQQFAEKGKS